MNLPEDARNTQDFSVLNNVVPALQAAMDLSQEFGRPYSIIGAIAVGLRSLPRATQDVDVLVHDERCQVERVTELASHYGFEPYDEGAIERARQTRVLFLRHRPTDVRVDICFGLFPFEAAATRNATQANLLGLSVPVCTVEDLFVLKAYAGRLQDIADLETLVRMNPNLDRERIERELRRLSRQLESPEIWERIESLPSWRVPPE